MLCNAHLLSCRLSPLKGSAAQRHSRTAVNLRWRRRRRTMRAAQASRCAVRQTTQLHTQTSHQGKTPAERVCLAAPLGAASAAHSATRGDLRCRLRHRISVPSCCSGESVNSAASDAWCCKPVEGGCRCVCMQDVTPAFGINFGRSNLTHTHAHTHTHTHTHALAAPHSYR